MLQTPLHDWHAAHGGRMVDFAGWHMPVQYTSIIEEHHAVRKGVGLFDISHMGRLRFDGPQALDLLNHLLTNDVAALRVGDVRYSLVCREDGGILDDVLVYRLPSEYLLVVNASNREKIVDWIESHTDPRDSGMHDATIEQAMIAIQGPGTLDAMKAVINRDLAAMKYYRVVDADVLGQPALVSRTGYTGEDGFEIMLAADQAVALWEKLVAAGARPCGLGCRDTLRLEAAMPLYGHEIDEAIDPLTADLAFGVKLSKATFVGRAALARISRESSKVRRVGLLLAGRRIARQGAEVFAGGQRVGQVTSGTFSPTLERSIAMAYVNDAHTVPGSSVEVDIRGTRELATVVSLPFYRR